MSFVDTDSRVPSSSLPGDHAGREGVGPCFAGVSWPSPSYVYDVTSPNGEITSAKPPLAK